MCVVSCSETSWPLTGAADLGLGQPFLLQLRLELRLAAAEARFLIASSCARRPAASVTVDPELVGLELARGLQHEQPDRLRLERLVLGRALPSGTSASAPSRLARARGDLVDEARLRDVDRPDGRDVVRARPRRPRRRRRRSRRRARARSSTNGRRRRTFMRPALKRRALREVIKRAPGMIQAAWRAASIASTNFSAPSSSSCAERHLALGRRVDGGVDAVRAARAARPSRARPARPAARPPRKTR